MQNEINNLKKQIKRRIDSALLSQHGDKNNKSSISKYNKKKKNNNIESKNCKTQNGNNINIYI